MGCLAHPTPHRLRSIVVHAANLDIRLRSEDELAKLKKGLERDQQYLPDYFEGKRLYQRVLQEVNNRRQL